MKVILLKNLKGKGRAGEVVEVPDGYAYNALIPQKIAKVATNTELNKIKLAKDSEENKKEKEKKRLVKILTDIDGKQITITEKLNEKGSLYHALGLKEIIRAIHEQLGISTPNHLYIEKYAFKEAGTYMLQLEAYNKKSQLFLEIKQKRSV